MQKCSDILFEEKATAFAALQKCISFNTDPNLLLHLLVQHFDSFSVSEKSEILDHCLQERHLNSGIVLALMSSSQSKPLSLFPCHSVHKLFKYCARRLINPDWLLSCLKAIFQEDIDINQEMKYGQTCLSWTLKSSPVCQRPSIVKFLLEKGASVDQENSVRYCLLSDGDDASTLECLKLLLEYDASLSKGTPLIWSFEAGIKRIRTMEFIMNHNDTDFSQVDKEGHKVLHCFIKYLAPSKQTDEAFSLLRVLLGKIGDNEAFSFVLRIPKVSSAVVIETLQYLTDINVLDSEGKTPLHNVICLYEPTEKGTELEIVQQIIKLGGRFDVVDKSGKNVLHMLVSRMKYDNVKILLFYISLIKNIEEVTEVINANDCKGNTVLHHACTINTDNPRADISWYPSVRVCIVRILLAVGANIKATNGQNQTVLHLLIKNYIFCTSDTAFEPFTPSMIELINLVLEHGIDQSVQDSEGKTALQYIPVNDERFSSLVSMIRKDIKPEELILK